MKVIYIMGAGHIGSTFLDIVLSNHPQIEGVGEISKLHRSGWTEGGQRRCGCGATVGDCFFWPMVRKEWASRTGSDDVARYVYLQRRFERFRRCWRQLLWNQYRSGSDFKEYMQKTEALYQSIQEVSGRSVIVDSSLTARRAYALSLNPNIDLRLLHLVRDGRGVIWSLMKPKTKKTLTKNYKPAPSWRSTKYWISANLQSGWVFEHVSKEKRQLIRYEDFVSNPTQTLKQIGTCVDEDLSCVAANLQNDHPLHVRHTVGGCRVRMNKNIRLQPDFTWMQHLPIKDRYLFWLMAGWLARRYGYRRLQTDYAT